VFNSHEGRYGYRRIWSELADLNTVCAHSRVRRIMKEKSLFAIQPKSFVPKTSDGRADAPSPNLLLEEGLPEGKNQVLAGDITYLKWGKSWVYLAVVLDLYSRKIVGWSISERIDAKLVTAALKQALKKRKIGKGAMFHSDRGSQYGSKMFRKALKKAQIRQSMSGRANPYHNAWTESCIGTIKREMKCLKGFSADENVRLKVFEYIETYYNTRRKHSSLGYETPSSFEAKEEVGFHPEILIPTSFEGIGAGPTGIVVGSRKGSS